MKTRIDVWVTIFSQASKRSPESVRKSFSKISEYRTPPSYLFTPITDAEYELSVQAAKKKIIPKVRKWLKRNSLESMFDFFGP